MFFTVNYIQESDKRSTKDKKKKGLGKLRHGNTTSFIPLFRAPSSIEKILDEAERENKLIFRPQTPPEELTTPPYVPPRAASQRVTSPRAASPRVASERVTSPRATSPRVASERVTSPKAASERVTSPRAASPRVTSPREAAPRVTSLRAASPSNIQRHKEIYHRPEPTLRNHHASATKIQAAYRGYVVRFSSLLACII